MKFAQQLRAKKMKKFNSNSQVCLLLVRQGLRMS